MKTNNLKKKYSYLLMATLVFIIILVAFSCANRYMKTKHGSERDRDETIKHMGDNPFEQSLYEARNVLGYIEIIKYNIMYYLLKELAKHDGLNSTRHQFLLELQQMHVLDDSAEVMKLFTLGLIDLDENWSENNQKNMFVDIEVTKRAEQIAAYNCFHYENKYPFDELGRLIMLHGVFILETWTSTTITVSFSNGATYIISENRFGEYIIRKAARSRDDLEVHYTDPDNREVQKISNPFESPLFILKQEGKVSTYIDYNKLEFSNINLHVIPCCFGDGRWNGKKSPQEEGPWHWSRAILDFYLNFDNIDLDKTTQGKKIELDIEYEIHRIALDSSVKKASEILHYQQELQNINKSDGLFFRVFTLPFYTDHDTTWGDYQLNLKVTSKDKKHITKYAFPVYDKQYELLVLDNQPVNISGIPLCQRIPTVEPGEQVNILIPIKNLPTSEQSGRYNARINFYLANNKYFHKGKVIVDSIKTYKIIDSSDTLHPIIDYPESSTFSPKSFIASFDINETNPDNYLIYNLTIPEKWSDNTQVTRGSYTLAALVTHHNQIIGEAIINNLKIE